MGSPSGDPPVTSPEISLRMSQLRRRDTRPEMEVRKRLHALGLRYRVCLRVPGRARRTIDVAFTRWKIAVFMDGCFWHGCPVHGVLPKSNTEWWVAKIQKNIDRDLDTTRLLEREGWTVLRFWEHEAPDAVVEAVRSAVVEARGGSLLGAAQLSPTPK